MGIHVVGKGRKERVLPLAKETAAALRAWLLVRGDSALPSCFINCRGEPLTRWALNHLLRRYRSAVARPGSPAKRLSPHVLRHTCAMNILTATKDLRKVALWLGHESVETTEIYTRAAPEEKFDVLNSLLPYGMKPGRFAPRDEVLSILHGALCGDGVPLSRGGAESLAT